MEENRAKKGDGMNRGYNFKYQDQRRLTEKTKSKWEKSQENNWGMPSRQRNSKCKGPEVAVPSVKRKNRARVSQDYLSAPSLLPRESATLFHPLHSYTPINPGSHPPNIQPLYTHPTHPCHRLRQVHSSENQVTIFTVFQITEILWTWRLQTTWLFDNGISKDISRK